MVFKVCFKQEIHCFSKPFATLEELQTFLRSLFTEMLPEEFVLSYLNPEGVMTIIDSEEYERLKTLQTTKSLKIFISERISQASEDEILRPEANSGHFEELNSNDAVNNVDMMSLSYESIGKVEESKDDTALDEVRSTSFIVNDIQDQIGSPNFLDLIQKECEDKIIQLPNIQSSQIAEIKDIVKETLNEQMASIISNVKETLLREGLINNSNQPSFQQPQQPQRFPQQFPPHPIQTIHPVQGIPSYQTNPQNYPPGQMPGQFNPYNSQFNPNQSVSSSRSQSISLPLQPFFPGQIYMQPQPQPQPQMQHQYQNQNRIEPIRNPRAPENSQPDFFDKIINIMIDLPTKALDFVDNMAKKMEGDPMINCAEGQYPQSVVDKVTLLKAVFPEADRKEMLEFVLKLPKDMVVNQAADAWLVYKQNTQTNKEKKQEK